MTETISAFKFKELTVYKKAFALSMEIFLLSKKFPDEEKFGLTSQIRRSSRSVCSSIGEGYIKEDILLTLQVKLQMLIWKTVKQVYG